MELVSLEEELRTRAAGSDVDAEDFLTRYQTMRSYLEKEYYPWIQAACPYFTDHGELHIRSVTNAASELLSQHLGGKKASLTTLDIFLILSSILWHDVGNALGRSGHAEQIPKLTENLKMVGFPNPDIQRLVNEISVAHKGNDGLSKPRATEDCATATKTYTVFPVTLAALVRFADEISENQARISHELLPKVPEENRVYWEYARSIAASRPDPQRQKIRIQINVAHPEAVTKFKCRDYPARASDNEITLIEYVVCRLEKMNNERAYCAPHFNHLVPIRELEIALTLMRDNARVDGYEEQLVFGDGGLRQETYPHIMLFSEFFDTHPRWKPSSITESTR